MNPMQKLALNLDDLRVQSFDTMPAARGGRGTVRAHESETYDELACSDACSLVATCYTCDTCDQACAPVYTDDTADPGRRIILY
jgi:hypothetical protein